MKFEQLLSGELYKINDIVLPIRNTVWNDTETQVELSIYNKELFLDDSTFIVTTDSFFDLNHPGYKIISPVKIIKFSDEEIRPILLVQSLHTDRIYMFDARYCIKHQHKFGKIHNKYIVEDSSWCNNLQTGYCEQLLNDNNQDSTTIFEIISEPYTKMLEFDGIQLFKEFINIKSPITNKEYSVLYYKENEVA